MTAEFLKRDKVAIAESDRRHLMNSGILPDNWRVWIGDYKRNKWAGHYNHSLLEVIEEKFPQTTPPLVDKPNTQSTLFVIGRLLIFAMSSAIEKVVDKFGADSRALPRIWPVTSQTIAWPPRLVLEDRDADDLAEFLMRTAAATDDGTGGGRLA